ncbi:DUF1492 domain-containing protein [Anaerosacchariphilus polymeriproducens]|uniref:DUF1492 domain-containing protein n=1 Tax=Anaerosacchariphilus polymeriproducens TaxID=1812858 RepID=A0A371AQR5_9FIRM|nr:DUF1492 domain-containing protein [Anaerosacchariphilus polymeriproducens]RDU21927.1 DUF1492 domain-containing protein [Anaerosacchariphilus polymeriproducens]
MTAKEYLYQLKDIDDLINSNQEEVDRLRAMATNISVTYSDEPHGSGTSDKVGNTVVKIADLENEINDLIDELVDLKREIISIIKQIKGIRERTILIKRYINNKTLEQSAVEMGISYIWARKIHGMALLEFEKVKKTKS